jgi:hypothetical protein
MGWAWIHSHLNPACSQYWSRNQSNITKKTPLAFVKYFHNFCPILSSVYRFLIKLSSTNYHETSSSGSHSCFIRTDGKTNEQTGIHADRRAEVNWCFSQFLRTRLQMEIYEYFNLMSSATHVMVMHGRFKGLMRELEFPPHSVLPWFFV